MFFLFLLFFGFVMGFFCGGSLFFLLFFLGFLVFWFFCGGCLEFKRGRDGARESWYMGR